MCACVCLCVCVCVSHVSVCAPAHRPITTDRCEGGVQEALCVLLDCVVVSRDDEVGCGAAGDQAQLQQRPEHP